MSCYWFHRATGKGTLEAKGVMGRVDIITGTESFRDHMDIPLLKKKLLNYTSTFRPYLFSKFSVQLLIKFLN
jgi:hypothetical protein